MASRKNNLMSRATSFLLSILLVIGVLPANAVSVFAASEVTFGRLSCITDGGSITDASGASPVATYTGDIILSWSAADADAGRTSDGWWVGVKMTAPADMTEQTDFNGVTYQSQGTNGSWSDAKSFWDAQDSDKDNPDTTRYLTMWGFVSEEYLNNALLRGAFMTYAWQFDWDADGSYEQVATLKIDPKNITLVKGEQTIYPSTDGQGIVSVLSTGLSTTKDENGSFVEVSYSSKTEPTWSAAALDLGRVSDGWWAGVKVTAPADMRKEADFNKVTYKSRTGNSWSEAKNFWNAQDSNKNSDDAERYLTMWGLMNPELLGYAMENGVNLSYAWQFDWNGDGVYEQMVVLTIDPNMVTLKEADGTQVYPALGTVSTISGGTVEGSGTGNVTVTADSLSLNWSKADETIGRNVDGWWAGIQITAPTWVDLDDKDVKYQSQVGDAAWSGDKSFNTNKDSDDYMTMWTVLTPEKLAKAIEAKDNIVTRWKFDWNGDSEYEQTVTFIIAPDNVTLNKVEQTDFAFKYPSPKNEIITKVWTGEKYDNPASGGQSGGEITYRIEKGEEFASVDDSGVLTFKTDYLKTASADENGVVGTVTVKALLKGNDVYLDAETEYTVTIYKRTAPGIDFEYGDTNVTYEPGLTYENQANHSGTSSNGIRYEIVSWTDLEGNDLKNDKIPDIDKTTGKLTIKRSGIVTVRATRDEDALYTKSTATYTLTINKAEQTIGGDEGFRFKDGNTVEKTWSETEEDNVYFNQAIGGESSGNITYSVVSIGQMPYGGPCAAFDNGTLTIYGKGIVVIKAVKAGDDCYNDSEEITYTLTIKGAKQEELKFNSSVPTRVTYNDNDNKYQLATEGGSGNGNVTYTVVSGDAVTINDSQLTVVKAGKVTIKAAKAATNTYDAAEVTLELVIEKAEQNIKFADTATTSIIYGNAFENVASPVTVPSVPDGRGYAALTGITYKVVEGNEIVDVDQNGALTFKNNAVGKIVIEAAKLGDDCYKDTSVTYTLEVRYLDQPDVPYTLSGDKKNESGWYTGDVTITPADGYKISFSNNLTDNEWSEYLTVSTEGYNGKTVYLKNNDGITGALVISENEIRIDKTAPSKVEISYSQSFFDLILETASFGFYKAPVTVTVTAFDETSHIDMFKYAYRADFAKGEFDGIIASSDPKFSYDDAKSTATATFEIAAQYRGTVSVKALDTAGNESDKYGEDVIIVDTIAPGVTVSFDNNNAANTKYYNAERTATIKIKEANFFLNAFEEDYLVITVTKDGIKQTLQNADLSDGNGFVETSDDVWEATIKFDEDGDYVLEIKYSDFSGNDADIAEYQKEFTIDMTHPELSISYQDDDVDGPANDDHYDGNRTATITIIEHNFRASDIVVTSYTAKNIHNDEAAADTKSLEEFQDFLRNSEWTDDGDTHTLEVPFDVDARYDFVIQYSDLAANPEVKAIDEEFCVDKGAPTDLKVSYSTSVLDTILETLTFGFYNAPVTVTITASDIFSGVDYFTYSYNVQIGTSVSNVGKGDTVISSSEIQYSQNGETATATFTIPAQFRGSVSFAATDRAGNTSETFIDKKVIVVDTVAPGITVTFDNNDVTNDTYYNADRTATITVSEANFFVNAFEKVENIAVDPSAWVDEHLVIKVTKVLNDKTKTVKIIKNADLTTPFAKTAEDIWTATLLFDENADYTLEIEYRDFSGNDAVIAGYQKAFTVDKITPKISISYDNNSALNDDHYKDNRKATITVVEHNFRASDIVVDSFMAVDIQGNPVQLTRDYQEFLRTGTWISDGDTHTIEVPFDIDARYSFTISYSDLADNQEETKIQDEFCIDKLAPAAESLKVSYSTSVLDTILETITFGFYKTPATVTIEADDGISGVDYFTYSYIVSEEESSTNVGKSNVVIPNGDITFSDQDKHAKATFEIPAQFRGNVTFTVTDRAGNTSALFRDEKVIVVDNVAPGISVGYDNMDASYTTFFKKSRTATITIKEANFFVEAFEKMENIAVDPSVMIDEHLIITVTKETNDGKKTSKIYKNADLTSPFTKTAEDTWTASLLFAEDADYTWSIEYTDFSGNIAGTFEDSFTVDNINPQISVSHSNNSAKNGFYFKENRPVTIVITEHNFNAEDVVVTVTSNKATGTVTDFATYLKNPNNWTSVGDVHTANIQFETEADYTFDIQYTDMAGRGNDEVDYGSSVAPKSFTLDKTAPTNADITINSESILATNGVAFEKFYRSTVVVKYTVNCDICGLDNITYQKVDSVSAYSENGSWTAFNADSGVTVSPSERFVIYFRAEDKAGNVTIVNSIGVVVDNKMPVGETYAPEIDIEPDAANANGVHHSDVGVNLKVVDPKYAGENAGSEGYYSGLNKITYRIYTKDTDATESGVLLDLSENLTTGAEYDANRLISAWTGRIVIDAEKFNSNNVIVEITAIDNAGNERVTTTEMIGQTIKIDITAPTIEVAYSNNDADSDFFFKADRTATIVITERNFNPDDVVIVITNTDGVIPALSGWTKTTGTGNEDDTRWTATITYSADGDYTFDISYTDMADNKDTGAQYGNSVMPTEFTIDKTIPVINVTYDNNSAQNDNYYKEERTATVTITEHNFNADRVVITITATDNGVPITIPTVNGWTSNGDVHTASIRYANDALYSFDITVIDKAGNVADDFAEQRFYVDKTNPAVSITEIVDESANNDKGNIGFVITATDTNFDVFTPVLTAVVKEGDEFKTKELKVGALSDTVNGKIYTVTNLDADGIYRITCTVIDKAGNAYSEITLTKEDGSTYVENRSGNDTLLTFSVNRDGSTFELDQKTVDLINKYYVQNVTDDIVIVETNADPLQEYKVTLNGAELSEMQYKVDRVSGEGGWEKYTYTLDKSLFTAEGEYTVVVSSRDKATNDAFSDVKDAGIAFVVDRTAPVITVTGLENDGRYQTESQTVTLVPTDDGGALKSIVVSLVDRDGNVIRELLKLSGEEFAKALENGNGQLTFEVPEGLYQNIRIVCDDEADYGSDENVIYSQTFTNVSVSSSAFMIFWANKPLRWASIGGVSALVIALVLFIIFKKKRKEDK